MKNVNNEDYILIKLIIDLIIYNNIKIFNTFK